MAAFLQVMANIATIVIGQEGPADQGWFAWQNMFIVIDIICCCAVLVPVAWSIKHPRYLRTSEEDEKFRKTHPVPTLLRHDRGVHLLHADHRLFASIHRRVQVQMDVGVFNATPALLRHGYVPS